MFKFETVVMRSIGEVYIRVFNEFVALSTEYRATLGAVWLTYLFHLFKCTVRDIGLYVMQYRGNV